MAAPAAKSAQVGPESRLICRVCQKQFSKYTCPQCNVKYCSLACYKSHSLRCTESFARSNVIEEMRDIQATKESQQSMIESLKRIHFDEAGRSIFEDESLVDSTHEDDEYGSQGTILSDKTIRLIEQGGDISWDTLSSEERSAFVRAIAAGELNQYIQPWNPWWFNIDAKNITISSDGTSLVHPVSQVVSISEASDNLETSLSQPPKPPTEPLAPIRQLLRGEPAPSVSLLLAELVYSYCFTMRFCNGDWQSEPLEAASILLSVSRALDQAAGPDSVGEAFSETVKTICSHSFKHAGGFTFAVSLFDDTAALLRLGRAGVLCALADFYRLLENAKRLLKKELWDQGEVEKSCKGNPRSGHDKLSTNERESGVKDNDSPPTKSFVDLRKRRDKERGSNGKRPSVSQSEPAMTTLNGSNGSSVKTVAPPPQRKGKQQNAEIKKISAAVRKLYFFMCWSNEQSSEAFSALALLVSAEMDKLMELGSADKIGLTVVQEATAPASGERPVIKEL